MAGTDRGMKWTIVFIALSLKCFYHLVMAGALLIVPAIKLARDLFAEIIAGRDRRGI
jgi:hypothetical protein